MDDLAGDARSLRAGRRGPFPRPRTRRPSPAASTPLRAPGDDLRAAAGRGRCQAVRELHGHRVGVARADDGDAARLEERPLAGVEDDRRRVLAQAQESGRVAVIDHGQRSDAALAEPLEGEGELRRPLQQGRDPRSLWRRRTRAPRTTSSAVRPTRPDGPSSPAAVDPLRHVLQPRGPKVLTPSQIRRRASTGAGRPARRASGRSRRPSGVPRRGHGERERGHGAAAVRIGAASRPPSSSTRSRRCRRPAGPARAGRRTRRCPACVARCGPAARCSASPSAARTSTLAVRQSTELQAEAGREAPGEVADQRRGGSRRDGRHPGRRGRGRQNSRIASTEATTSSSAKRSVAVLAGLDDRAAPARVAVDAERHAALVRRRDASDGPDARPTGHCFRGSMIRCVAAQEADGRPDAGRGRTSRGRPRPTSFEQRPQTARRRDRRAARSRYCHAGSRRGSCTPASAASSARRMADDARDPLLVLLPRVRRPEPAPALARHRAVDLEQLERLLDLAATEVDARARGRATVIEAAPASASRIACMWTVGGKAVSMK